MVLPESAPKCSSGMAAREGVMARGHGCRVSSENTHHAIIAHAVIPLACSGDRGSSTEIEPSGPPFGVEGEDADRVL
jgi:hypothetical protein